MIQYAARVNHDTEDGIFNVSFPDLPGCVTYGETLEKALFNAQEALSGYLESIDARGLRLPDSKSKKGRGVYFIKPDKKVAFALQLKLTRLQSGKTQKEIARELNVSYQTYQRFENPGKSNPTLKTIQKLEQVLDSQLVEV